MRYNCKKILNNIKSVVPHPDLEKIVKKDLTIAKQKVNNKHFAIMTGITTGIINEEMGFKQMMLVYEEVDDMLSMWIDQVNNMIEFLEDVKEQHGFIEYMKLDADQQKMFDHIHKEILKYQRLNAEIMGLSVYIDTLMGEYGLLEEFLEGIGEDPDEDEDDENLDILHESDNMCPDSSSATDILKEAESDYLEEEGIDQDLYREFKEKLTNAKEIFTYTPTDPDSIVVSITYLDGKYQRGFAIRCNRDDTFELGDNAIRPSWIIPRFKLNIHQFETMINDIDGEDNPFVNWYCGDDKNGFPEIYKIWHPDDAE
jgi:hypothetical protein